MTTVAVTQANRLRVWLVDAQHFNRYQYVPVNIYRSSYLQTRLWHEMSSADTNNRHGSGRTMTIRRFVRSSYPCTATTCHVSCGKLLCTVWFYNDGSARPVRV